MINKPFAVSLSLKKSDFINSKHVLLTPVVYRYNPMHADSVV